MLSAAGGCELSTKTCENRLVEIQGAATSSLFPPPLFQDTWLRVQLLCEAQCSMPVRWPLTKPNLQCLQQNDRAMIRQICNVKPQDVVTTKSNELLARLGIEDLDLILKESSAGMDMWNAPIVQSRQPLTYRLTERVGLGGLR